MRATKFRQAAFVYLHVAILYEAAAYAMWKKHLLPRTNMGPAELWLVLGALVGLAVFWGLWRWQNPWLARGIWLIHGLRLPSLIGGAFFAGSGPAFAPPAFYITAIVAVVINLWMLARAGWDL